MARRGIVARWNTKPAPGSRIDYSHPLTKGLIGCWLFNTPGLIINLVNNSRATFGTAGVTAHTLDGVVLAGDADYEKRIQSGIANAFVNFGCVVKFTNTATVDGFQRLVDKDYNGGFWMGRNGTTSDWGGGVREGDPYGRYVTLASGVPHQLISTRNGTAHSIWGDGIKVEATGTVAATACDGTQITFGYQTASAGQAFTGILHHIYLYDRALSKFEAEWLYAEQYAIIQPPVLRTAYSIPVAVTAVSFLYSAQPMRHMLVR